MSPQELEQYRAAENRKRASRAIRLVTGFPDRWATIGWQQLPLPGRDLPVRVYRPARAVVPAAGLPLVLHVHGGGFVGTAPQSDWLNSHLAARLPALVVSVDHRLLAPGVPMSAAADDGWDALRYVTEHAEQWGIDPTRTALVGESVGGTIAALAALRARAAGMPVRAQVLVNPVLDLAPAAFDQLSDGAYAASPTISPAQLELLRRLAVPPGSDPRAVSPLSAVDLGGLAPCLAVVPVLDPLAGQARAYVARLREAGTTARTAEYPGAGHAFLSMPRLVPQARAARAELAGFLRGRLSRE